MARIKKVQKAQKGYKLGAAASNTLKPTYKNLRMGVANQRMEVGAPGNYGANASKEDSALYRFGFGKGLRGEKEYPGEPPVQKMGRWEGQNVGKKKGKVGMKVAKKMAKGGSLKPVDSSKNPGLAKLPTPVRNKMGYQKNGGKSLKKQAATAIAMKKAGKTPKTMKRGGSMKNCRGGCY